MVWCCQETSHKLSHCWPDLCHHVASLGHKELTWVSGRYAILHISQDISSNGTGQFLPKYSSHSFFISKCMAMRFNVQVAVPVLLVHANTCTHPYACFKCVLHVKTSLRHNSSFWRNHTSGNRIFLNKNKCCVCYGCCYSWHFWCWHQSNHWCWYSRHFSYKCSLENFKSMANRFRV